MSELTSRRLLRALDQAVSRLERVEREQHEPIAIIGMGCRLPGSVRDVASYWRLLVEGRDAIAEVPPNRWSNELWFDPNPDAAAKIVTRYGGFLDEVEEFDYTFFGMSPREALTLDPQHRLVLEVAWEALENAGHPREQIVGTATGVFVGITTNDYARLISQRLPLADVDGYVSTGNASNAAAGRLSYFLGLHGPSIAIDTACSSSLVAVHLACQSLRAGECDMALAGGVNLILAPEVSVAISQGRMLSPDGRCKTFDADADGYGRGEGCGMLVLKRASDARAARDPIVALIRGSAVNQDGESGGFTVPSGSAQQQLIRRALANARLSPGEIDYVEAHGTGTALGDPIEVNALGDVFNEGRARTRPLFVGSVKANIGHLESAAGAAGLIKAALALANEVIPPHRPVRRLNPHVAWHELAVTIPREPTEWKRGAEPRRAGVSSFGASGTNAHVVLEEAPIAEAGPTEQERPVHVLALSARTPKALRELVVAYAALLTNDATASFADVCYSANTGRTQFAHRVAVLATDATEAIHGLETWLSTRRSPDVVAGDGKLVRLGLHLTNCPAPPDITHDAYAQHPSVRELVERCADIAASLGAADLRAFILAEDTSALHSDVHRHLAAFVVHVGIIELLGGWGIRPIIVSSNACACAAAAYVAGLEPLVSAMRMAMPHGGNGNAARSTHATQESRCDVLLVVGSDLPDIDQACDTVWLNLWSHADHSASSNWHQLLRMVADLYARGVAVDWRAFDADYARRRVLLPTYPWQRERCWIDGSSSAETQTALYPSWLYEVEWRKSLGAGAGATRGLREPSAVVTEVQAAGALRAGTRLVDYDAALRALETRSVEAVQNAMLALGWPGTIGERVRTESLRQRLGIVPRYGRFLGRLLEMLEESGSLRPAGVNEWTVVRSWAGTANGSAAHDDLAGRGVDAEQRLLSRCAAALPTVLRGEGDAVAVVFPDGDVETAAALYRDAPGAHLLNGLVGQVVQGVVRDWPATRRLRVLEVGAGTGGTTAAVLAALPRERTDYTFSDLSARFLAPAAAQFASWGRVQTAVLDIEQPAATQGFAGRQYDLIVAANVLHATRELRASLQHLRELLAPGGVLVLLEGTAKIRFVDLIFGLLDGWWRFADTDLRPTHPLLSADAWTKVLTRDGFATAAALTAPDGSAGEVLARQAVIVAQARLAAAPGRWVIVPDAGGVGAALAETLEARGDACHLVDANADAAALAQVLASGGTPLRGVVHLASLDNPPPGALTAASLRDACAHSCGSALQLVQALISQPTAGPPPRLFLVTRDAISAERGNTVSGLAQSPLWGLGLNISLEHPDLRSLLIDVEHDTPLATADTLLEELLANENDNHVALRNSGRCVARLVRHVPRTAGTLPSIRFRDDATYLMTGGFGGLGVLVAEWMFARGVRHLVLVGRTAPTPLVQEKLSSISQRGSQLDVILADVADDEAVNRVVQQIGQTRPPLRGVIHAAGVLDDAVVAQQDWTRFSRVLDPKVIGAWNLVAATRELSLDFFVLFSSGASMIGSPGQSNHAAANAFLDACAHYQQARGVRAISVNWGAWAETGAAARRNVEDRINAAGLATIPPQHGLEALGYLMATPTAQIGVLPIEWTRFIEDHRAVPFLADFVDARESRNVPAASEILDEIYAAPAKKRRALLEAHVEGLTRRVLRLPARAKVDANQGFFELGMDSLTSMELKNRLQKSLQLALPNTLTFDHPTPAAVVAYLLQTLAPAASIASVNEPAPAPLPESVDHLSSEELDSLIDAAILDAERREIRP